MLTVDVEASDTVPGVTLYTLKFPNGWVTVEQSADFIQCDIRNPDSGERVVGTWASTAEITHGIG